MTPEPN